MLPPGDVPRDENGRPFASPLETKVARLVIWVASVWFVLAASWELFGPLLAGHYASSASVGIIAENMLRWHIPGPVWEYTASKPGPEAYYCHHPWGIFWTTASLMKVFGRHDFVCRLAPVLLSAATPPLIYDLGRSIYRPAAGAAAALAFVVCPIALAFANFNALEVPVIAWSLLFLWGFVRLTQTGRRRHLAASLAGLFLALNADWPAFVLAGEVLAFTLARSLFLRGVFGAPGPRTQGMSLALRERRFASFWLAATAITAGTLLLYLAVFSSAHKLGDLFGSAEMRQGNNQLPLVKVLASRRYWIELSFTPIAILIGKIGAVVCLGRAILLRREHEILALAVLGMAAVQYVVFKQGADVHVFWPHYFALYFALAVAALVATIASLLAWSVPRLATRAGRTIGADTFGVAALGVAMIPLSFVARDGVPALVYARETGGRFNEKGLLIHSDGAKTAFLAWLAPRIGKRATVDLHEGMKGTWAQVWSLGGRVVSMNRPPPPPKGKAGDVYLADTRFMLDEMQGDLATRFHVTAVGPFWKVARAGAPAPLDAFAIDEREPGALAWYFVSGTEPTRTIRPDPFATWELRTHFGQAGEGPSEPPRTLEERRVAHNIALASGDRARADELLASIRAELDVKDAPFDDGSELVGAKYHEGARSLLTLYVRAGGPTESDVQLTVRSKVLAPATLSTTMADPTEREVGLPLPIAPKRWKAGFLYADAVPIRKRPGHEIYRASFWVRGRGTPPRPVDGSHDVVVLDLR